MSLFKHLLKNEFLQQVYSLKFLTMSVFAVLFGLLCVSIQIMDYQDRKTVYDEEILKAEEAIHSAKVYSQLQVPIVIEPNPLSIFAKGSDEKIGNRIVISVFQPLQFEDTSQKKNPFMAIFSSFDLVTLVQILFSIMALFLVSDSIAGEREAGTLKQTFSNSLLKSSYFLAKYLGGLFIVAMPLTFIFLLSVLLILWQPFITLSAAQWLTVFLIYLCCLFFVSTYVLIGLVISSRSSSSSLATLMGLLVWIGLVFVYPNCSRYIVSNTVPVPTADTVDQTILTMEEELEQRTSDSFPERHSGANWYNWYEYGKYGLPQFIGLTQKYNFDYNTRCVINGIPIILSGQEEIYQTKQNIKKQFINQRKTSALLNRLLPGHLLYQASTKIAGTHYRRRDLNLLDQAKIFREQFLDYIRSKNGFGLLFFTRMNPEEMKDNYEDYTEEIEEANLLTNHPPLEIDDMPVFRFPHYTVIPAESMIDLSLLLVINILLFIIGGFLFSRAEVRIRD